MIEVWDGKLDLEPLALAWMKECVPGIYDIDKGLKDLCNLNYDSFSTVLVLTKGKDVVGVMGIEVLDMFFTSENYSAVRYWYILPAFRHLAKSLVKAGKKWSQEHECAKMMVCSSGLCGSSEKFLKLMGFKYFETVFVGDV